MAPVFLLFLSGAAALVFQVLWVKEISLVVGIDVHAVTTAVSAFFAGLAAGGLLFGPRADRTARPYRLYGVLEILTALSGVAVTLGLSYAAAPFAALDSRAWPLAWLLLFLLVGLPAAFMGGTVPVLVRAVSPGGRDLGRTGGRLYAANTAGAIAGALLAPFCLVPAFGVRGASIAAAALNLTAAMAAFVLAGSDRSDRARPEEDRSSPLPKTSEARRALALYAFAGALALGYEVAFTQALAPLLSTRSFAFAVVVATYVLGLAAGSALYARVADRVQNRAAAFGTLIASAGLLALLGVLSASDWILAAQRSFAQSVLAATGSDLASACARFALAAGVVVLPATLCLGAAFPAVLKLVAEPARTGRDVGAILALNTIGGIAGTLLTGFVLVPYLGLTRSLGVLAIAAVILGAWAHLSSPTAPGRNRLWILALGTVAFAATLAVPRDLIGRRLAAARGGDLVFYEESAGGAVAVLEQRASHERFRRLYVQGVSNSGDAMTSIRYMRLQALLPLLLHRGEPRSALVVGLGTGITCGALLRYPLLEQRVCVELLPSVVRAAARFEGNYEVTSNPRVEIRLADGRRELLRDGSLYDVITLEPPPPSAAGVVNLYSRDFYELARSRLASGGILAQWWPLPTQNDEDSRSLVRSFLDAFPHASLWTTEIHEMLLIGSREPLEVEASRIAERFRLPEVSSALAEVGIDSEAALLATWVTGREGLLAYVDGAPPVTDDRPLLEHAQWLRRGEFARVLPRILSHATDVPVTGASDALRSEIAGKREILMALYDARIYAYRDERDAFTKALRRVLEAEGDNPYYRWVAGGS
jgi:predicted membrane-bound spermidine synthase